MACVAEFGIIDEFEKDKDYSHYEPQKYNCVAIEDDILNDWWGVTLIPPESLEAFYSIISKDKRSKSSVELIDLMILLRRAISEDKYVIHYGV